MELIVLYALLCWFNPSWVEIPLHAYFLLVGCQTLYSYLKARLGSSLGGNQMTVKVFAGVLTVITALSFVLHLIVIIVNRDSDSAANQMTSSFWQE